MNRKNFLGSIVPLGAVLSSVAKGNFMQDIPNGASSNPAYLKKGDTIGITSPAGYISQEDLKPALDKITEWGFRLSLGKTIGKRDFTFGGTDEERLADFQMMLDDKSLQAILCARGGYGLIRIIDRLDFSKFVLHPKWIIGFSDVTILHCHLNRRFGIASIHSKMCNSFPKDWNSAEPVQKESIESIRQCISGIPMKYSFSSNDKNKKGYAAGELVGGNLKTIESLIGTSSDLLTQNKILLLEDTSEYLYSIDRMFWHLKRSGKLSQLKALIIGGFNVKKDDEGEEFGKSLEEIVLEKVKEYNYPVCFDFPVGHQKNNFALKCGIKHKLSVQNNECILTEIK
jgi:muramoyltetrapeptide carboxypeptidase